MHVQFIKFYVCSWRRVHFVIDTPLIRKADDQRKIQAPELELRHCDGVLHVHLLRNYDVSDSTKRKNIPDKTQTHHKTLLL